MPPSPEGNHEDAPLVSGIIEVVPKNGAFGTLIVGDREFPATPFNLQMFLETVGASTHWPAWKALSPMEQKRYEHRWHHSPLAVALFAPSEPRRRGGKRPYIETVEQWRALVIPLIRQLDHPGDPLTAARLAPYLHDVLPQRSHVQANRQHESVERYIRRMEKLFRSPLKALIQEVRSEQKNLEVNESP